MISSWLRGAQASTVVGALLATACGNDASNVFDSQNARDAGDSGFDAPTPLACPNGDVPTLLDASDGCPSEIPAPGSCCSRVGTSCTYSLDGSGPRMLCVSDPQHAPFWQENASSVGPLPLCPLADAGGVVLGADAAACGSRPAVACASQGDPQNALDQQVASLVSACGGSAGEIEVEVEFLDGCATQAVIGAPGPEPDRSCIERTLDSQRWLCAVGLQCGVYVQSSLPTP
jgi:hypothetical protein